MPVKMKHFRWVGILLFLVILWNTDFRKLSHIVQNTSPAGIALYAASIFAFIMVRVCRIWALVRVLGYKISLWRLNLVTLESGFWGLITPGRIGEFSRIFFLKQSGIPTSVATLLSIIERLADLFFLLLVGLASVLFIGLSQERTLVTAMAAASLVALISFACVSVSLVFRKSKYLETPIGLIWGRLPQRWRGDMTEQKLLEKLGSFSRATFLTFVWTGVMVLIWKIVTIIILARAVGLEIGLAPLIAAYSVSALLSTLPFTINGLGLRESGYIGVLTLFGVTVEEAVLFSIVEAFAIPLLVGTLAFALFKMADMLMHSGRTVSPPEK